MWKKIKPYVFEIALALAVGALAALITGGGNDFYEEINKPRLSPPPWLFPVVWSILYVLMGISAGNIRVKGAGVPIKTAEALRVYYFSLVVNFFWCIVFFNFRWFLFAFLWLCLLWVLIFVTIRKYREISPFAGYLQIPYILWVTFAGYLNLMIFLMN